MGCRAWCILLATALGVPALSGAERMDLASFARPCCAQDTHRAQTTFDYGHPRGLVRTSDGRGIYGLQWAEERDLFEIAVRFRAAYEGRRARVEYWFQNWPHNPPKMPTIEDPVDDPWQGQWLRAETVAACEGQVCRFTFLPLAAAENPRAANLPGVRYRRAVRFRLVFPAGELPVVEKVEVFSQTEVRRAVVRVRWDIDRKQAGASARPEFHAYNGWIRGARPIAGGQELTVDAADPRPAGSQDVTVVEVTRGEDRFSFCPADVEREPMYVPDYHAYLTSGQEDRPFSPDLVRRGARIRERLASEPEQTYERASREIPALDPVERQGGRLYLPLAADASWQKFAFEWGGNVAISKTGTKAYGKELARLTWKGDRIGWMIGTGDPPEFRPRSRDSTLAVLENYLPVATAKWRSGNIEYEEEAFATLLEGPLSSEDAGRNEQTPAVLMVRLRASNRGTTAGTAHLWLRMASEEPLAFDGTMLTADEGRSVRAHVRRFPGSAIVMAGSALHGSVQLAAGGESTAYLALPFVPGLTAGERARLAQLDYGTERRRVVGYWRGATARGIPFQVPEERFDTFARGLIARIRISATKDPRSGLYMVPAASYGYKVFANEAAFQAQLLDVAGYADLSRRYLETPVALQGSKPFRGSFTEQKGVYHGARVDDEYDYTASNYNLDHGTVLWTLVEHYWMTRDRRLAGAGNAEFEARGGLDHRATAADTGQRGRAALSRVRTAAGGPPGG